MRREADRWAVLSAISSNKVWPLYPCLSQSTANEVDRGKESGGKVVASEPDEGCRIPYFLPSRFFCASACPSRLILFCYSTNSYIGSILDPFFALSSNSSQYFVPI